MKLTANLIFDALKDIRGEFTTRDLVEKCIDMNDGMYKAKLEQSDNDVVVAMKRIYQHIASDLSESVREGNRLQPKLAEENLMLVSGESRGTYIIIAMHQEDSNDEVEFNRSVVIRESESSMTKIELNRIKQQKLIMNDINDIMKWKNSDFSIEWDHAQALADNGKHHPDNGQLITRQRNRTKMRNQ